MSTKYAPITKEKIKEIAYHIRDTLIKLEYASDTRIYYNNKCIDFGSARYNDNDEYTVSITEIGGPIDPHDYFEWAAYNHILSMSFEGPLYDYIDNFGQFPEELDKYFKEIGIFWELGNMWNCTFYPINDEIEVEYTVYEKPVEPLYIFRGCRERFGRKYPEELDTVMDLWYHLGQTVGDVGCCAIGYGLFFTYKNIYYEMHPVTGFQGEYSWEKWVELIKDILSKLGAINISWYCGRLD